MKSPAVFFDRDGTLIHNVPYNGNPDAVKLLDDVPESLLMLKNLGYALIVVTNQSGVARGFITEAEVTNVNERMQFLIIEEGGPVIDGVYYCPHHPDGVVAEYTMCCDCRKPAPGMVYKAVEELNLDLRNSWIIGDHYHSDMLLGLRLGLRTVFFDSRGENEKPPGVFAITASFHELAEIIATAGEADHG